MLLALAVVVAVLASGCLMLPPPPPPPGAHVTVYEEGPLPPPPLVLLPPPPIILPPAPVVVYSPVVRCDVVTGLGHDVFYVNGYFYTHHHDHWYCTMRPGAGWVVVERPHVPRVLAPGPPPPGWNRALVKGQPKHITQFKEKLPFPVPPPPPPAAVGKARGKVPATTGPQPLVVGQPELPGKRTGQVTKPLPPGQVKKLKREGGITPVTPGGSIGEPSKGINVVPSGPSTEGPGVTPGKGLAPGKPPAKATKPPGKKKGPEKKGKSD